MAVTLLKLKRKAAVSLFDEQVERKDQRLRKRGLSPERTDVGGVAEAVLKDIDPKLLERIREQIANDKALESQQLQAKRQDQPKQNQRKRIKERDQGMEL